MVTRNMGDIQFENRKKLLAVTNSFFVTYLEISHGAFIHLE